MSIWQDFSTDCRWSLQMVISWVILIWHGACARYGYFPLPSGLTQAAPSLWTHLSVFHRDVEEFLGLDGVDGRDCDSYFWHYFVQLLMLHLDLGFVVVLNPVWLVLASLKTSSNAILMYNEMIGLFFNCHAFELSKAMRWWEDVTSLLTLLKYGLKRLVEKSVCSIQFIGCSHTVRSPTVRFV
jgi:hypothetical protein